MLRGMNALDEARQRPMHTAAEVARWARTTPQTARRWITGYTYNSGSGQRWSPPVARPRSDEPFLTFEHVVEIAAVAALRRAGLSMQRIRADIEFARRELDIEHPLLSERFLTDGRELFLRDKATHPHFTNLSRVGQLAWSELEAVLRELDYAEDLLAQRWWPAGRDVGVVVDPLVNFGRPVVAIVGVRTETLGDRWAAGVTLAELAAEYRINTAVVERAVQFENRTGAIAA
jgi:uncharacterized protein (DUF433 family)